MEVPSTKLTYSTLVKGKSSTQTCRLGFVRSQQINPIFHLEGKFFDFCLRLKRNMSLQPNTRCPVFCRQPHLAPGTVVGVVVVQANHGHHVAHGGVTGYALMDDGSVICVEGLIITKHFRYIPRMEVLYIIRLFWGWDFPCISQTYSLHR